MAACNGPGGEASVNNISANYQVSDLIEKFNMSSKTNATISGTPGSFNQAAAAAQSNVNVTAPAAQIPTWADRVENTTVNHDYKLTVFFRKNSDVGNTNLSQAQKGRLIFKRLNVPRGKCLKCDDSKRDRLILTISGSVPTCTLHLTQSFEAKPGLWTKPIAPIIKDKVVYLYWTSDDMENNDIVEVLEYFGTITDNVEPQVYWSKEDDDEESKMMDGVQKSDRMVKMKVRRNIPSIILVKGKKVRIHYEGQAKNCPRCLCRLHICPSKGDARKCEEIWERRHQDDFELGEQAKPRGDLEEMMRRVTGDNVGNVSGESSEDSGIRADYVEMINIPEEVEENQLLEYLRSKDINIRPAQLVRDDDNATKWRVHELLPQEVTCMMLLVDKNRIGKEGNKIRCFPAMTSTPIRDQQPPVNPSAQSSPTEAPGARKDLDKDLKDLGEGKEVSCPKTVDPDGASRDVANLNTNLLNPNKDQDKSDSVQMLSDDSVKEVTEDDKTLPKPAARRTRKNSVPPMRVAKVNGSDKVYKVTGEGEVNDGEKKEDRKDDDKEEKKVKSKEAKKTAKGAKGKLDETLGKKQVMSKGRATLKELIEEAKKTEAATQEEARKHAEQANKSKDEKDMKKAEIAEKVAAEARRKVLALEAKLQNSIKKGDELVEKMKANEEENKRKAEGQSPEKEEESSAGKGMTSGKKTGRNEKKKTKAEIDLENSFYN